MTPAQFLERIERTERCWYWTGSVGSEGYGTCWLDGRKRYAHRVSYELHVGPIAPGLVLLHACDERRCVRPDHLTPGSERDNARDRADKHRGTGQRRRPIGRRWW